MDARVNITMPKDFLRQVDRAAKREHRSRSELIREALRLFLSISKGGRVEQERKKQAIEAMKIQDRLAKRTGRWDTTLAIRKIREGSKF